MRYWIVKGEKHLGTFEVPECFKEGDRIVLEGVKYEITGKHAATITVKEIKNET